MKKRQILSKILLPIVGRRAILKSFPKLNLSTGVYVKTKSSHEHVNLNIYKKRLDKNDKQNDVCISQC